jgi:hypothetical protein
MLTTFDSSDCGSSAVDDINVLPINSDDASKRLSTRRLRVIIGRPKTPMRMPVPSRDPQRKVHRWPSRSEIFCKKFEPNVHKTVDNSGCGLQTPK